MLRLDAPFVPDGDYPAFLAANAGSLTSVHFSLFDSSMADARQLMESRDRTAIISGLNQLPGVRKYVLMNARVHAPDKYFDKKALNATANSLESLLNASVLDGVIFADPYYLQALSDAHPSIAAQLEAVPSINAILDSAGKTFSMLGMIGQTEFKPPSRIVLDRSLNRDIQSLETISTQLRKTFPDLKLHLIANEGCLYQCPYKPAHDAHIALVNEGLCGERTFAMNRDFGCVRRLLDDPGAMLASPFIRPEDMTRYEQLVDAIKLCGRNKGISFLERVIGAYARGSFHGNLLDLMDAMGDLSDQVDIPNHELPDSFFDRVTACNKDCRSCGWCADIADTVAARSAPGLHRL